MYVCMNEWLKPAGSVAALVIGAGMGGATLPLSLVISSWKKTPLYTWLGATTYHNICMYVCMYYVDTNFSQMRHHYIAPVCLLYVCMYGRMHK